ncbi:MAG: hypothetical protein ILP10_02950 [Lachnospiraceae bacterium]|nr:hypothetical protein [Lachnospiraceae bacterium]
MTDNQNNEAEALFATRRKKQQDEEAQRAAKLAEEERLAELERQKQQVTEDIKRLESLKELQQQQAEADAQRAQAEREALERERELARQAAAERKAAKKASGEKPDIKKFLPFIIGGAALVVVVIVLIATGVFSSGKKKSENSLSNIVANGDWYRVTDEQSGVSYVYPALFDNEDSIPESGFYTMTDVNSDQVLIYTIMIQALTEEQLADADKLDAAVDKIMEEYGVKNYDVKEYKDGIVYAECPWDDYKPGEYNTCTVGTIDKDGFMLLSLFEISKEREGVERTIDIDDALFIFEKMVENTSLG